MTAPARSASLRENTRRACVDILGTGGSATAADSFLLGYVAAAAEHRPATELRAVVLGVLDARRDIAFAAGRTT